MKSIFAAEANQEIFTRLNKLSNETQRLWGKMDVAQMLAHCNMPLENYLGKIKIKPGGNFIIRLFKPVLYNNMSFGKGAPTAKEFIITDKRIFEDERKRLLQNINDVIGEGEKNDWPPHVTFGKMTGEQIGRSIYKHLDHHLKQFGN